jgi:RNA ligase (TIGR02306 family)
MNTMRKLATIREIEEIKPIPEADKICAYRVDDWWVVDTINKYQVNDLVIYCEVDSWIPHELAPFLSKGQEPREYNGVKGERLKTVKLRGQISQDFCFLKQSLMKKDFGLWREILLVTI